LWKQTHTDKHTKRQTEQSQAEFKYVFSFHKTVILAIRTEFQMMKLSQLEELKKTRTELEEESRSLKEEQKQCEEMIQVLEEKIVIEEIKKSNKSTQETLSQLRSKISELDQRFRELSQGEEASAVIEDVKPEATSEASKPADEEVVTVTAFENSAETQQEEAVGNKKREEKKHKLW
jgi:predicted nuclease with TOPRIM domain